MSNAFHSHSKGIVVLPKGGLGVVDYVGILGEGPSQLSVAWAHQRRRNLILSHKPWEFHRPVSHEADLEVYVKGEFVLNGRLYWSAYHIL
jgi:hypothetical protein